MEVSNEHNANDLICPPGMELEVFNSLNIQLEREVVEQQRATVGVAEQLVTTSFFYPEALDAFLDDMLQEIIAQEQEQRRLLQEAHIDPSNSEEMYIASFVACLSL